MWYFGKMTLNLIEDHHPGCFRHLPHPRRTLFSFDTKIHRNPAYLFLVTCS
jgi:hypothetical protein